jgi:two-component system, chemotaxis family, chemotaxis protein CheY
MKKIMIVDDSMYMRNMLRDILPEQYGVVEADSGSSAIATYDREQPDLVFLDIVMPEGDTEGMTVLDKIKKKNPKAKVVMISAVGQDTIVNQCKKLGAQDYILKPFDDKQVVDTVAKHIG